MTTTRDFLMLQYNLPKMEPGKVAYFASNNGYFIEMKATTPEEAVAEMREWCKARRVVSGAIRVHEVRSYDFDPADSFDEFVLKKELDRGTES